MPTSNVGTTIPTLAVLALSMAVLGIGFAPAFFALFVALLLPIVRNACAGLLAVRVHLKEVAHGMGMTHRQILLRVEIPDAMFVILSGIDPMDTGMLLASVALIAGDALAPATEDEIVVGGKKITERQLLTVMTEQLLAAKTFEVASRGGMGSAALRQAMGNGQIDVRWE